MGQYCSIVSATSNGSGDTEDTFLDITPAASRTVKIVRIRVSCNTAADDSRIRVKVCRKSAQGTGSIAGIITKKDPGVDTSANSTQKKDTTVAFTAGTIVDVVYDDNFNARAVWEFVARSDADMIRSGVAQIIGVNLLVSAASKVCHVLVEWEE